MKAKSILKILFIASLVFPAGCDVKDPIFKTPHPGHGMVTLTTDWSGIGEGLTVPAGYTVTAASYSATLSGTTNKLDHLFEPGNYRFLVHNNPEHLTVESALVSVRQEAVTPMDGGGMIFGAGPADDPQRFIHSAPDWLFTCALSTTIERDTEHTLTAVMQQQVRQLTLIIEPTGGTTDRIERVEGYLSGAAGTLNIDNGTHAAPANVGLQFSRITSGANAGKWFATVRLLGIAGAQQKLNAKLYFAGGNPAPVTFSSDLSEELAAFNTDKRKPFTLSGRIVETPTEAGFGATITDWTPVSGSGTAD